MDTENMLNHDETLDVEILFDDKVASDPSLDSCSCCCTSCCCTAAMGSANSSEE